jgi:hypothetical protein
VECGEGRHGAVSTVLDAPALNTAIKPAKVPRNIRAFGKENHSHALVGCGQIEVCDDSLCGIVFAIL